MAGTLGAAVAAGDGSAVPKARAAAILLAATLATAPLFVPADRAACADLDRRVDAMLAVLAEGHTLVAATGPVSGALRDSDRPRYGAPTAVSELIDRDGRLQ